MVVLDYGSGNLRSAQRALARAGARVRVTGDLTAAAGADGLVVPGVGAYAACMAGIGASGAAPLIADRLRSGRPVLGICVGMQILFGYGAEDPRAGTTGVGKAAGSGAGPVRTAGLGLLPGGVVKLAADRIPHMGWNTVSWACESPMFAGLAPDTRFYFVHSYAARPTGAPGEAVTRHGDEFLAAVVDGPLWATQFHPEKSGDAGAVLLRNWVATLRPVPVDDTDGGSW